MVPGELMSNKNDGFTLLEVLIALVILAIAFIAVLNTTQSNIRSAIHVKKALASDWVAINVYSELQMGILQLSPDSTSLQGTMNMMQSDWNWQVNLDKGSGVSSFKRIAIDVTQKGKRYQHLVGFIKS
jgi:general secretion pathway protein I